MMEKSSDWQPQTPLLPALMTYLTKAFPSMDEQDHFAMLFDAFDRAVADTMTVTLRDAAFMNLFCDSYYLHRIMPIGLRTRHAASADA
jgi:hypothetical protein